MASLRPAMHAARMRLACVQCRRPVSSSAALASGHNRWSKIKHEKGAADAKKTALRSSFSKSLTLYSQLYGADPGNNPQLASVIAAAKKAGVPKATIEGAIARGQGRSTDGARLESATIEILMAPSIAVIVELETDGKIRAMQDFNTMMRRNVGTATPTKFFFTRRGRVVLGPRDAKDAEDSAAEPAQPVTADDVLDDAIEAGAEDVETDDEGNIVVWTAPNQTNAVVSAVAAKFQLVALSAETIWAANEDTMSPLGTGDDLRRFADLVAAARAYPDVRAIYANVTQGAAPDDVWQQIEQDLDW